MIGAIITPYLVPAADYLVSGLRSAILLQFRNINSLCIWWYYWSYNQVKLYDFGVTLQCASSYIYFQPLDARFIALASNLRFLCCIRLSTVPFILLIKLYLVPATNVYLVSGLRSIRQSLIRLQFVISSVTCLILLHNAAHVHASVWASAYAYRCCSALLQLGPAND